MSDPEHYNATFWWYRDRNCYCEESCHLYQDCCSDVPHSSVSPLRKETFDCAKPVGVMDLYLPVHLVNRCPESWWDQEVSDQCQDASPQNPFSLWPVVNGRGTLYQNSYCAFCNGATDTTHFTSRINCSNPIDFLQYGSREEAISSTFADGHCKVLFYPPADFSYKYCKKTNFDTCSPKWTGDPCVQDKCENGPTVYAYGIDGQTVYKNKYCAECNMDTNFLCEDNVSAKRYPDAIDSFSGGGGFFPLTILFDLNTREGTMSEFKVGQGGIASFNTTTSHLKTCEESQVYDPYTNRCRQLTCSPGYIYTYGRCIRLVSAFTSAPNQDECARIALQEDEFILYDNDTLEEVLSGNIHEPNEYELVDIAGDVTALVCTNLTQNYTHNSTQVHHEYMFQYTKAQTILSATGQVISIIALVIHLVVYSLIPQLRNLPGKNLMCLSASLLVAQIFFLAFTGLVNPFGLCQATSIFMHYAYLAAFFWMNVLSFDLWSTFAKTTGSDFKEDPERWFLNYSLYGWGSPFVVIVLSVIVNYSVQGPCPYRPGYGEGLCWITNRYGLLLFFAVPLAVLLLLNSIFYVLTVVSIHRISESTKMVQQQSDKVRLILYIKLSAIMGLTWLFGFIATLAQVSALWYIFILFNSLQGAFICLTFVCTKKVCRLLKEKMSSAMDIKRRRMSEDVTHTQSTYLGKNRLSLSTEANNQLRVSKALAK